MADQQTTGSGIAGQEVIEMLYRHRKRGTLYRILGEATAFYDLDDEAGGFVYVLTDPSLEPAQQGPFLRADESRRGLKWPHQEILKVRIQGPILHGTKAVLYQAIGKPVGDDCWARGRDEFFDGRFEEIGLTPVTNSGAQEANG